jgi:hypothetical protein
MKRDPAYDLGFVLGVALIALACLGFVVALAAPIVRACS